MSTEKLVKSLGKYMERRTFIKGLGVGAIAALSALLGMPKNVSATVSYKCCNLCYSPTSPCSSQSCPYAWCWFCNYAPESRDYKCCECYNPGATCNGSCAGVSRSYAYLWGTQPAP